MTQLHPSLQFLRLSRTVVTPPDGSRPAPQLGQAGCPLACSGNTRL